MNPNDYSQPVSFNDLNEPSNQIIRKQNILLKFSKMAFGEASEIFHHITETVAAFFEIERVSIWLSREEEAGIVCVDLFEKQINRHQSGAKLQFRDYPVYFNAMQETRCIAADDVFTDTRTLEFNQNYHLPLGIKSMMDMPLRIEGKFKAILCCEKINNQRKWSLEDQDFASSVADIISLVIQTEERRKAVIQLKESEEKYRKIVDNAVIGIYKSNLAGQMLYINQAMAEMLEFDSVQDALNYDINKIYRNPEERKKFLSRLVDEKSLSHYELCLVTKEGNLRHVLLNSFTEGENILGMILDITDRKNAEEEFQRARVKAEESDRLKTSLMANMSHEFRTPMNAILGFSALIATESQDPDVVFFAKKIHSSGQRLMTTLKSILDLADLEGTKSKLKLQEINVQKSIQIILQPFYPVANEKNLHLITEFKDNIVALADENLLQMILFNLIDNAIKFTLTGGVTIETDLKNVNGNSWVLILIKDTGIGIPSEHFQAVFHEFRQLSEGYSRSYEGTGLGLTLAQRMASMMEGHISLESEVGLGSIFTLWLPASWHENQKDQEEVHQIQDRTKAPVVDLYEPQEVPLVLVVEDNDDNAEIIKLYLRGKYKTERAADAFSAISMASAQQFAGVLMDINLGPGIDGLKAVKEIRKLDNYRHVPIIAITGYTMAGDQEKILAGGCTQYLGKPFSQQSLLEIMKEVITRS